MTRRPSEKRPAGLWKKVIPLGGGACSKAAEIAPVSELESPKLNIAGKLHCLSQETGQGTSNRASVVEIATHDTICLCFFVNASINLSFDVEKDTCIQFKQHFAALVTVFTVM